MKNLRKISHLGVFSYTLILLISCEPEDVATTIYPPKEGVQDNDIRTSQEELTFIFDLSGRKDGTHYIGENPATGSKIEALLKEGKIYGFAVKQRDGKTIRLLRMVKHATTGAPPPPPLGCPDGFDWRCVCYIHPVYDVKVCVSFCVANTLVLVTTSSGT